MSWLNSNMHWHTAAIMCPTSGRRCAGQSCTAQAHPCWYQYPSQPGSGWIQASRGEQGCWSPHDPSAGHRSDGGRGCPSSRLFCTAEWHQATSLLLSPATCRPRHCSLPVPGAGTRPTRTSHTDSLQLPEHRVTTAPILPRLVSAISLNVIKYLKANHQMALTPWQVSRPGAGMFSEVDFQFIALQHPGERKRVRPSLHVGQEEATFNGFSSSFHTVLRWSAKQPHCLFFKSCLLPNLGSSTSKSPAGAVKPTAVFCR